MGLNGTCEQLIKSKLLLDESIRLGMLVLSVTLPMELTNKNKGQGHSWHHTAGDREDCETCLRALGHVRKPFTTKMNMRITRILGKRQHLWDQSSVLRGSAKQLEDALVSCGWFVDDSPEWIGLVIGDQEVPAKRGKPQVKIEVFQP
jgi:hypothetical protein